MMSCQLMCAQEQSSPHVPLPPLRHNWKARDESGTLLSLRCTVQKLWRHYSAIKMSILPMLVNLADDLDELDLDNTRFTVGRWPQELQCPERRKIIPYHPAPYWQLDDCSTGGSEARMTKADGFQMTMDVSEFKASEIEVKTVAHSVIVEGNHEEREDDHGFVSRHFVRRFEVPAVCDIRDVVSTLSSDGILVVRAPLKPVPEATEERQIQVQQTGTAHHEKKRRHSAKGFKERM